MKRLVRFASLALIAAFFLGSYSRARGTVSAAPVIEAPQPPPSVWTTARYTAPAICTGVVLAAAPNAIPWVFRSWDTQQSILVMAAWYLAIGALSGVLAFVNTYPGFSGKATRNWFATLLGLIALGGALVTGVIQTLIAFNPVEMPAMLLDCTPLTDGKFLCLL